MITSPSRTLDAAHAEQRAASASISICLGARPRTACPGRGRRPRRATSCRRARSARPAPRRMPWMSSGVVSMRTRITSSPCLPRASAVSASNTTAPTAAPGDAFRPWAITLALGARGRSSGAAAGRAGRGRSAAAPRRASITPSSTRSRAILTRGGRRALAGAGLQQVQRAALDRELDVLHVAVVALEQVHRLGQLREARRACSSSSSASGCGVRMPATTSSPWALSRYSP